MFLVSISQSAKSQKNLFDIFDNCSRIQIRLVNYHLCDDIKELRNVFVYKYTYQHYQLSAEYRLVCIFYRKFCFIFFCHSIEHTKVFFPSFNQEFRLIVM